MDMADQVGVFLASWQQLSVEDRKKSLAAFSKQPKVNTSSKHSTTTKCPSTVYSSIRLSSYYNYIYYYPTIHWSLNRTPLDDTYWVGIFQKDAADDDYIACHWIERTAQGSYKIGKLDTKAGMASKERFEEFELRIFRENQRLKSETNTLRGMINIAPTNSFEPHDSESIFEYVEPDAETVDFIKAIENPTGKYEGQFYLDESRKEWNSFAPQQQQLLLPILKQSILSDDTAKAGPKRDKPEPKIRFADTGFRSNTTNEDSGLEPDKIVLTITLDCAYTHVFPQVHVQQEISKSKAWMGMYYPQSEACFDPDSYIDKNWAWVGGTDCAGTTTKLDEIEEYAEGPTNTQYLGVIFDAEEEQLGFAASTIEAAVFTTPAFPPVPFEPDFDKNQALRYAELSLLAYKPYSEVKDQLSKFNLTAEMQIHDSRTDTSGFIARDDTSIVVAFRGTDSFIDMMINLNLDPEDISSDGEYSAHDGFVTALDAVFDSIENQIKPYIGKKKIFVTGHSLGGALATLATYRISRKYENAKPIQFVYGCPPVGNMNLANYFKQLDSHTITIEDDIVSTGALVLLGPLVHLFKPYKEQYLPSAGGHSIVDYVKQLKKLCL